jgi:hypothetical protein
MSRARTYWNNDRSRSSSVLSVASRSRDIRTGILTRDGDDQLNLRDWVVRITIEFAVIVASDAALYCRGIPPIKTASSIMCRR